MSDSSTIGGVQRGELARLLTEGIGALRLRGVSAGAEDRLLTYVGLLHRWNRAYNLTAVRDPREMVHRHLLDSLSVAPHLQGRRVLDVGTGAGLPGMVLALAFPEALHLTLLDPAAKRIRFLQEVMLALAPDNVTLVRTRVEDYTPEQRFETVTCRAFASLGQIVETSGRLVAPGGALVAFKGERPTQELDAVPAPWRGGAEVVALAVPGLAAARHLIILRPPGEGSPEQ